MFRDAIRYLLGLSPSWKVVQDGGDLLVMNVWATAWGVDDPEDDGETASGLSLNKHPNFKGVSLPMRTYSIRSLRNSPIPHMPFGVTSTGRLNVDGTFVIVEDKKTGIGLPALPVIDLGPSLYTGNAIDLTVAAARLIYSSATARNFKRKVNYRIVDGAKYL